MNEKLVIKAKLNYYFIGLLITLILALISINDPFVYLERKTVDWRMAFFNVKVNKNIVLIGITEEDIKKRGPTPWPRTVHAEIIEKLSTLKPAVIGYAIIFPGYKNINEDNRLVNATQMAGNVIYPVYAKKIEGEGVLKGSDLIVPFDELVRVAAGLGHQTFTGDPDTMIRRFAPALLNQKQTVDGFSLAIYKQYKNIKDVSISSKSKVSFGQDFIPVDNKGLMTIVYAGSPGTFKVIPFYKLLSGEVSQKDIEGKIVLVGAASPGTGNFYNAPGGVKMSELEFHANTLNTIISGRFFGETDKSFTFITIIILGLITTFLFSLVPPIRGLGLMLLVCILYGAVVFGASYL